ncbi:DUF2269 family protein [Nonomuraea longispora]|uniref:DUF2269 family protein n=1 Tax=Nonomuraea longispora TaxID=1848320 RepID=A0A4R4N9N4_9ACTN|nr:DUF2269 family protein [Nonomuraea longispora]TDC03687.1 DUF2269 family protein [Nonomuraea longispora]
MTGFLLTVHVIGAILTVGPMAVATSMFPRAFRSALSAPQDLRKAGIVSVLARITRVYSLIAVVVPIFGVATAASLGVLTDTWLIISMALTVIAAAVLIGLILPGQRRLLDLLISPDAADEPGRSSSQPAVYVGIFNLLWVVVVTLMIYRPGSTTGVS